MNSSIVPLVSAPSQEIRYYEVSPNAVKCCASGKHGSLNLHGLALVDRNNRLVLKAITSRNQISPSLSIEIPKDKETLTELINMLDRALRSL